MSGKLSACVVTILLVTASMSYALERKAAALQDSQVAKNEQGILISNIKQVLNSANIAMSEVDAVIKSASSIRIKMSCWRYFYLILRPVLRITSSACGLPLNRLLSKKQFRLWLK